MLPPQPLSLRTYPFFLLRCVQEQGELARKVADTEDSASHPHPTRNPHRNPRLHPHLAHMNSRRLKHSSSHSMRPIACAGSRGGCDPTPTHLHLHLAHDSRRLKQSARAALRGLERAAPPLPTNHPPPRTQVQSLTYRSRRLTNYTCRSRRLALGHARARLPCKQRDQAGAAGTTRTGLDPHTCQAPFISGIIEKPISRQGAAAALRAVMHCWLGRGRGRWGGGGVGAPVARQPRRRRRRRQSKGALAGVQGEAQGISKCISVYVCQVTRACLVPSLSAYLLTDVLKAEELAHQQMAAAYLQAHTPDLYALAHSLPRPRAIRHPRSPRTCPCVHIRPAWRHNVLGPALAHIRRTCGGGLRFAAPPLSRRQYGVAGCGARHFSSDTRRRC